jgi:hypothetical protein
MNKNKVILANFRSLSLADFANFTKTLEDVVFPKCQVTFSFTSFCHNFSCYLSFQFKIFLFLLVYFDN